MSSALSDQDLSNQPTSQTLSLNRLVVRAISADFRLRFHLWHPTPSFASFHSPHYNKHWGDQPRTAALWGRWGLSGSPRQWDRLVQGQTGSKSQPEIALRAPDLKSPAHHCRPCHLPLTGKCIFIITRNLIRHLNWADANVNMVSRNTLVVMFHSFFATNQSNEQSVFFFFNFFLY